MREHSFMCPFALMFVDSTAVSTPVHGLLLEELTTTKRPSFTGSILSVIGSPLRRHCRFASPPLP